ncbi:UNVERIFIED_CONTAM: carbohydrate ABC transporter substrate-binding protein (CUT1 family) [Acetivibrio alkalicellulosi]
MKRKLFLIALILIFIIFIMAFQIGFSRFPYFKVILFEDVSTITKESPYHIVWYHIGTPQKDTELVFNEVSKYTLQKINATVEMRLIDWGSYNEEMEKIIASREKFDICFTAAYSNYVHNSGKGAFFEIDSLLETYGQGIIEVTSPLLFEGAKINGKLYAVPLNKEVGHQNALTFNKQYIDKYCFDLSKITKLEDIEPWLQIIKEKEPDIIPYLIESTFNNSFALPFDRIVEGIPGALYYDNRTGYKVINELNTPVYKEYFKTMHKWYKARYIHQESVYTKQLSEYQKKGNWFASVVSYTPHVDISLSLRFGYDVEVVPLNIPVVENRDCRGSMLAISSTSQNPQKAMMFLELLSTDKYLYNLVTYGVEGVHYIKNNEYTFKYPDGINEFTTSYTLAPFTSGNMMLSYININFPRSLFDDYKIFSNSVLESPLLGFDFDPTNVKKEISALLSISSQFEGPLKTGAVDPDIYLPKAIEKYKSAGLDIVLEEQQRQLDEWLLQKGISTLN